MKDERDIRQGNKPVACDIRRLFVLRILLKAIMLLIIVSIVIALRKA